MGEIARDQVVQTLRDANPQARAADIEMYTDAFMDYRTAQANITEYGSIVNHPRTGSPIENPYLKIRSNASTTLLKMRLVTDELWK